MPWTVDDVDKHKKGLSTRKKRQWVAVANSVLRKCMEDGKPESECAASAIRQANGVVGNEDPESFSAYRMQNNLYQVREAIHQGKKHIVVPVILMVEGVHNGSHGPILHRADELSRFTEAWNGIPVSICHPERDGVTVSCNSPDVIDDELVGRVYNARFEDNGVRGEAWLDIERLANVSPEALNMIKSMREIEVSAGLFSDDERVEGEWNGESYVAVAHNYRPDHLALLPNAVGACSIQDGCGVRAYVLDIDKCSPVGDAQLVKDQCSNFYVRVESSSEEREAMDKAFVAAKTTTSVDGTPVANDKIKYTWYQLYNPQYTVTRWEGGDIVDVLKGMKDMGKQGFSCVQINLQGFREVMEKIQGKLDRMDDDTKMHFLQEVYEDNFVYEIRSREGGSSGLYRRTYQMNGEAIEFTGEPVPVVRKIEYVTHGQQEKKESESKGGETMPITLEEKKKECPKCVDMIMALIESEDTRFEKGDMEFLLQFNMEQLEKFAPSSRKEKDPEGEPGITESQAIDVLKNKLTDPKKVLPLLQANAREKVESGLRLNEEMRGQIIKTVMANAEGIYSEDELKAKDTDELQKLERATKPKADFTLFGPTPEPKDRSSKVKPLYPVGVNVEKKK